MIVVFDIFVDSGVVEYFKLDDRTLALWISRVASNYKDNPYHNFSHATHVLHATYLFLMASEANNCVTRTDQLALLIAAICHDIDHDGKPCSSQDLNRLLQAPPHHIAAPTVLHILHCYTTF